jgi:murein DD-endopeptidase MepM/ murein hydrolase activator NlpD
VKLSLARPLSLALAGTIVAVPLLAFSIEGRAAPGDPAPATAAPSTPEPLAAPQPPNPALSIEMVDRKITELDAEEQSSRKELLALGGRIAQTKARIVRRGKAFYRLTRVGMLPVGGGFEELVRHAMRVERERRTLTNDIGNEKALRARSSELSASLERLSRDRSSLVAQRSAMDSARLAIEDESRRQNAFDKAFESSNGPSEYVAVYGSTGASPDMAAHAGFAAARGRLLFPVVGRAEVRAAHRGAPVRATYPGRVAFADRYGPYGRIVILDHGDHYYTVSGNLASIDVRVGAEVAAAERVGTVGDDGHGAMLYFEVRHGAQTVAPGPWLGL